ncbi:nuclear transport factor 2 family protein [Rhodococcus maanshanensis]|uniref:SnoaL-like domain-containing protein n=1 Tax=Rhodococcus maanshanensis TaxID=183556 RepID=A0A1H7WXI1_9NOCA|nr:nuclear transport factor 2 family protein [Rhodococcus maanshanensis]SEM25637.1 SnoaL-like domain-containing protein [Rhodococcus maanshanensis]
MVDQAISVNSAIQVVERLAHAKSRQDAVAAMAIYHPEAVLESPPLGTRSVGPEVRGAIEGWFAFAPDYEVRVDGHGMDGETLCCWGEISLTPAFTWTGAVPNGRRATVPVFMLFRFEGGRVSYESFHFDVAGVARQCGVDASALVGAS